LLVIGCSTCLAISATCQAQDDAPQRPVGPLQIENHSWAQFTVGSWKLARVTKEVFGSDGQLESVTIQDGRSTLVAVADDHFTLREEVTVEVAGRRFSSAARNIERGLYNESTDQVVTAKPVGEEKIVICRREYPSQVHEITVADDQCKRVTRLYYSPHVEPFILKRETKSIDLNGESRNYESTVEVLALEMPHRVLSEILPTTHMKTVHVHGGFTTVTLEVCSSRVPGHVVSHTATKVNATGEVTERSTLELLGYGVANKQDDDRGLGRTRFFGKRRLRGSPR